MTQETACKVMICRTCNQIYLAVIPARCSCGAILEERQWPSSTSNNTIGMTQPATSQSTQIIPRAWPSWAFTFSMRDGTTHAMTPYQTTVPCDTPPVPPQAQRTSRHRLSLLAVCTFILSLLLTSVVLTPTAITQQPEATHP